MKVDYIKPEYARMIMMWEKMRDTISGQEAVKAKGEKYLPALSGQEEKDYEKYIARSIYYNATGRTSFSYNGMIFRKKPKIVFPDGLEDLFTVVTQDGKTSQEFLMDLTKEVVDVNRVGVLVDMPNESTDGMTIDDVEKAKIKPFWVKYKTEQIINWDFKVVENTVKLSLVVLTESFVQKVDIFEDSVVVQFRVLRLVPDPREDFDGEIYIQEVYQKEKRGEKEEFILIKTIIPQKNGEPINFIPFYIITENGIDYKTLPKPLLSDMADVNLGHYKNSADYENELHWSGIKTVIFPGGKQEKNRSIKLGKVLLTDNPESKPYILEATAGSALENEMENKERRMVSLGAEQIIDPVSARQTATGQIINSTSKNSTVAKIANAISIATTEMLRFTLSWIPTDKATQDKLEKEKSETRVELNTDFLPVSMTGPEMIGLIQAWQKGVFDMKTLRWNFRKGEAIPNDVTDEQLQENIDANPPDEGMSLI